MLESITLKNFRSISKNEFSFWEERTIIHWKNGSWKTTVLEAISLLSITPLSGTKLENLVSLEQENFFISAKLNNKNMSFAYNKALKKKVYAIEWKNVTKKKFMSESLSITSFTPTTMNMFLLGPSKRRDFLDHILKSSFFQYDTELKKYEKVLKNRNAVLKSINKWNSPLSELEFWDKEFTTAAISIYRYRYVIVSYFQKNIKSLHKFMPEADIACEFFYKVSVDFKNIEDNFKETIIEENKLFLSFPQSDIKQLNEIKEEINTTEKKNKKEVIKNKILQKESLKTERKEISNENLKTEKKDNPKKEQNFKLENPKQIFNSEKPKEEFSKKSQKKENIKINGNSEKILKILKSDFQNFNKKFTIEIINIKKDFQNFKTTNKTEIKKIKTQIEKSKKQSPKNFLKEQKESLLISDLPSLKMGHIIYNKKDDKNIFEKENKNPNEEEKNNFINKANLVKSIDLNNSEENYKIENSVVSVILDENNFMRYKNMKFVLSDSGKKINLSSNKKKFLEQQNYEIF